MSVADNVKADTSGEAVIFSFLSRVDRSPVTERPRSPGHVLNAAGEEVSDDKLDEALDPLGARPDTGLEKWVEYWRKVHGARFLHGEDGARDGLGKLKQYVQLHRYSAGPNSGYPLPYAAPVDEDGKLFPTIAGHIPEFARPAWDGVAFLTFESITGISEVLGSRRFATKIAPEDDAIFRGVFPMLGRKSEVATQNKDAVGVTMIRLHFASPEFRRVTRIDRTSLLDNVHVRLRTLQCARDISSFTIIENQTEPSASGPFNNIMTERLSGVSLLGFPSMRKMEDFVLLSQDERMFEFETDFCEETQYYTAINFDISP